MSRKQNSINNLMKNTKSTISKGQKKLGSTLDNGSKSNVKSALEHKKAFSNTSGGVWKDASGNNTYTVKGTGATVRTKPNKTGDKIAKSIKKK